MFGGFFYFLKRESLNLYLKLSVSLRPDSKNSNAGK